MLDKKEQTEIHGIDLFNAGITNNVIIENTRSAFVYFIITLFFLLFKFTGDRKPA